MSQEPSVAKPPDDTPPGTGLPGEALLKDILHSTQATERHLHRLASHKLLADYGSTSRQLLMQFLRGAAFGLGSVLGAGVVLSLLVYLLSQIQFVPILGEWIKVVLEEIHK